MSNVEDLNKDECVEKNKDNADGNQLKQLTNMLQGCVGNIQTVFHSTFEKMGASLHQSTQMMLCMSEMMEQILQESIHISVHTIPANEIIKNTEPEYEGTLKPGIDETDIYVHVEIRNSSKLPVAKILVSVDLSAEGLSTDSMVQSKGVFVEKENQLIAIDSNEPVTLRSKESHSFILKYTLPLHKYKGVVVAHFPSPGTGKNLESKKIFAVKYIEQMSVYFKPQASLPINISSAIIETEKLRHLLRISPLDGLFFLCKGVYVLKHESDNEKEYKLGLQTTVDSKYIKCCIFGKESISLPSVQDLMDEISSA